MASPVLNDASRDQLARQVAELRAAAYNRHYSTAGWKVTRWTRQSIDAFLAYALDVEEGGNLNGNEIMHALGRVGAPNLAGKTVLDCCCGTGVTAIYFALCGAQVYACDRSQTAIRMASESAVLSGVGDRVRFDLADAQELPYAAEMFDAVFCQSALHILVDYPACPVELARVLKPGAKAVFCEEAFNRNPILRPIRYIRRRHWRQCGGRPLTYQDIAAFGQPFAETAIYHFNLLAQAKNLFQGHLERHGRLKPWLRRILRGLERFDRVLLSRARWLQPFCGKVVVEYTKGDRGMGHD